MREPNKLKEERQNLDFTKHFSRLAAILVFCSGCQTMQQKPAEVPFYECYKPIENPEVKRFTEAALTHLEKWYSKTDLAVNNLLIRESKKSDNAQNYQLAENFSLLEIVDETNETFCIYIGVKPTDERFYFLLAHEIGHLLHPTKINSAAEEHFCNEFARRICEQENKPFDEKWENRKWVLKYKESAR